MKVNDYRVASWCAANTLAMALPPRAFMRTG